MSFLKKSKLLNLRIALLLSTTFMNLKKNLRNAFEKIFSNRTSNYIKMEGYPLSVI